MKKTKLYYAMMLVLSFVVSYLIFVFLTFRLDVILIDAMHRLIIIIVGLGIFAIIKLDEK